MNCIVEKKFLFWKWKEVEHSFKVYSIEKFMWCSEDFVVHWKCSVCERVFKRSFVSNDSLVLKGVSQEILNKVGTDTYYLAKNEATINDH